MRVTNAKGEVYKFDSEEVTTLFMWAYGYMDLSDKGHLPIDLDVDIKISELKRKLKECMKDQVGITEKTRRYY